MRPLTELQAALVHHFTSNPETIGNGAASARAAGYAERSAKELARQTLALPHVQAAIEAALKAQISGQMAVKAAALVERIVDDETAPLRVRLDAAKTVLDRGGFGPPGAAVDPKNADKTPAEMTNEELQARLRSVERARSVLLETEELLN